MPLKKGCGAPTEIRSIARRQSASLGYPRSSLELTFSFENSAEQRPEVLAEEGPDAGKYIEGATKTITVNVFERNPQARDACVAANRAACSICRFDFADHYGDIGIGYIHVHHLRPLGEIRAEYELDAVNDLRPVRPNCHAMIHRRRPAYSIEEIREIYSRIRTTK